VRKCAPGRSNWLASTAESGAGCCCKNAEIAGLDNDGRMCGQPTELKLQNFIHREDFHSVSLSDTYALLVLPTLLLIYCLVIFLQFVMCHIHVTHASLACTGLVITVKGAGS